MDAGRYSREVRDKAQLAVERPVRISEWPLWRLSKVRFAAQSPVTFRRTRIRRGQLDAHLPDFVVLNDRSIRAVAA